MLKVFIGDITKYLAETAKTYDKDAYLCSDLNFNLNLQGSVYTSLGDLSLTNFYSLIDLADDVWYFPPNTWSSAKLEEQTYIHLNFISNKKTVKGFNKIQYNPTYMLPVDSRKTNDQQIWIVGCSFAHGLGVSQTERYGSLFGNKLGLPVAYLTSPGSSVRWAADQILRADIQPQDIVVWGITGISRFSFLLDNNQVIQMNPLNYNNYPEFNKLIEKKFFVSNHMFYESIPYIDQVIKYFKTIGNRYILGVFPLNIEEHENIMLKYLSQFDNSVLLYTDHKFLDIGDDGLHPGALQHKYYANTLLDFYHLKYK